MLILSNLFQFLLGRCILSRLISFFTERKYSVGLGRKISIAVGFSQQTIRDIEEGFSHMNAAKAPL